MSEDHELLTLAKKLRYDLTGMQVKVTELITGLSALDIPVDGYPCPRCGTKFKGSTSLAEHVYISHGGPVPEHWERAEQMAEEPAEGAGG